MKDTKVCFNCGSEGTDLYGYIICDSCKSKLGLFTKATIQKNAAEYKPSGKKKSYKDEILFRLDFIEKDYIKKKIKLIDILEKLNND